MSTIEIQQGPQSDNIQISITALPYIKLKLNSLKVIKGLLAGTESDEWLKEAEALNG